ncbi:MAG: hypothetical protein Q8884_02685 [Sweet potato little leaf phytoplasma]|nr:hypothetical protein [Sweet potato little leaf phytoplasma]
MSNINNGTNTIFISGLAIRVNEDDKVVFLGLIDAVDSENEYAYNFALPKTVLKNLLEGLTLVSKELGIESDSDDVKLEE